MLTTVEKMLVLSGVDLFAAIESDDLVAIARVTEEESFAADDRILTEGEIGDRLYFVVEGRVSVIKGERQVAELGERQVFGELAVLDPAPRSASVVALTEVTVLRIERDEFADIMAVRPEIAAGVIKVLTRRLRGAIE